MKTLSKVALGLALMVGIVAGPALMITSAEARPYSCTTNTYGNTTYTNCY